MATLIDFPARRPASAAPAQQEEHRRPLAAPPPYVMRFNPPTQIKASRQNRYDAAFKGYMTKRARDLRYALYGVLEKDTDAVGRAERIRWAIAQIDAIEEQVLRETPEHFPAAGA